MKPPYLIWTPLAWLKTKPPGCLEQLRINWSTGIETETQKKPSVWMSNRGDDGALLETLLDDRYSLEDDSFKRLLVEALIAAIDALPAELKAIVQAQALDGCTFKELSQDWGVPQGTLLSRKRKALSLLREALEDFYEIWEGLQ